MSFLAIWFMPGLPIDACGDPTKADAAWNEVGNTSDVTFNLLVATILFGNEFSRKCE